jgi:hypothetical protein
MRGFRHEIRNGEGAKQASDGATDGDFVRENKVLKVDESAGNEKGDKKPEAKYLRAPLTDEGPITSVTLEDEVEENSDEEFDPKVAG